MDWFKIIGIIAGGASYFAEHQKMLPETWGVVGSGVFGTAVALKAIHDKRKRGAPIFNLKRARGEVKKP